jgi:hypothetical protein
LDLYYSLSLLHIKKKFTFTQAVIIPNSQNKLSNQKIIIYLSFILFLSLYPQFAEIPNIDFIKAYYPTGRSLVEHGTFQYEYGGLKNIPIIAFLLVPFALTGLKTAMGIFLGFELLSYLVAFIIAIEYFAVSNKDRWCLLFLFTISRPFYIAIFFGQLTPLAFLLLLLMILSYTRGRKITTGLLLTSLFLIKIPPGLLFTYFLWKKEYKIVFTGIIGYVAVWILSITLLGWQLHVDWFNYVIKLNVGTALLGYNNQTIFAFVLRLFKDYDAFNWYPISYNIFGYIFLVVVIIGTIAWFLKQMPQKQKDKNSIMVEISMIICLFLMIFPLVWDHYYLFLIFPFFTINRMLRQHPSRPRRILMWLSFVLVNPPVAVFYTPDTPSKLLNIILMSSLLLGCLILLILLRSQLKIIGKGNTIREQNLTDNINRDISYQH